MLGGEWGVNGGDTEITMMATAIGDEEEKYTHKVHEFHPTRNNNNIQNSNANLAEITRTKLNFGRKNSLTLRFQT